MGQVTALFVPHLNKQTASKTHLFASKYPKFEYVNIILYK